MSRKNTSLILTGITLVGFATRLSFFAGNNFPLHDGGFFYVMIQDLLSNRFALPDFSSYNQAQIPFIYPPLGLYVTGIIEHASGASRLQLFRIIPLLVTTATIPLFFTITDAILKDKRASLAAAAAYSLLPRGTLWLILGGGVTRSFGAFFGMLALIFTIRFIESGGWMAAILGSAFCGFTVLSHPEWAWFLFYSTGLFVLLKLAAREWKVIFRSSAILLGTAAIILPWLLTIIHRHGQTIYQPLLDSGFSRWNDVIRLLFLDWSGEVLFPVMTLLAMVGIFQSARERKWFPVLWLPLVFILQGRAADQKAVVPLALLAGAGITAAFSTLHSRHPGTFNARRVTIAALGIFTYSLIGVMIPASELAKPLEAGDMESFEWIKQETPADAKILVITGRDWIYDSYSEWMAALTGRASVSLVQGYEWLPGFSERISRYYQLQYAYSKGMADLAAWIDQNSMAVDYLALPKGSSFENRDRSTEPALHWHDALLFPGVEEVFENERVLILDMSATVAP